MMRFFTTVFTLTLVAGLTTIYGQRNLTWKSTADTNWVTAANWYDEGLGGPAASAPTSADYVLVDSSRGATVNVTVSTASQACKKLTIGNGFILKIRGTNVSTLNVGDNGSGNYDIQILSGGEIQNISTASSGSPFTVLTPSTDVMRIESGGKYLHSTARSFSTPFPNASRSFDANSTVEFNQTSATAISMSGSTYGNLILSSTATKTYTNSGTGTVTINGTLTLTPSTTTLTASISGAHTIKNISNAGTLNLANAALTITGNITNNGTITFNSSASLTFNGTTTISGTGSVSLANGATVNSSATITLGRNLDVPSGKTLTLNGTLNCSTYQLSGAGALTVSSSGVIYLGSLNVSDAFADNIPLAGTLTFDPSATIELNGSGAQKLGTRTYVNILRINNTNGVQMMGSIILQRGLTLQAGTLDLNSQTLTLGTGVSGTFTFRKGYGTLTGVPTFNYTSMTVNYTYSDTAASVSTGSEIPSSISGALTVSTTNAFTLSAPLTTGTLTLSSANLNTTAANLLTISSTTTSAVTANSYYINGPLARTLPASLTAGSNYSYPIGKSVIKAFELNSPTTTSGGTVVIQAEVFDDDCGGTAGTNLSSINNNRYWAASIISGAANFTNTKIRLTESGLGSTSGIGQSSTLTGSYNSLGGTFTGPNVVSTSTTTSLDYFVIGVKSNMGQLAAGTYSVGSGNYPDLAAVLDTLNSEMLTGNVIFELSPSYVSSGPFPLTFYPFADGGNDYNVTIRPALGATNLEIAGNSGSGIIVIDGADHLTIDGRPGGVGTVSELSIRNYTYGSGVPAILIQNDASYNTIEYCTLHAIDTSSSTGVISIKGTTGSTGNDYNTITYCNINADSCTVGIYSGGTSGYDNNNGSITNNNIYNFFVSANSSQSTYGIRISSNNSGWTISNNSVYQTTARTYSSTDASHRAIEVSNSGTGYTIDSNYVGGSSALCGGSPWTISGGAARWFGLNLTLGNGAVSNVQGNVVKNINVTSSTTSSTTNFTGIYTSDGTINIGTTAGNMVGDSTTTDNIVFKLTANSVSQISGFYLQTVSGTITCQNNAVSGMTLDLSSSSNACDFYVINVGTSSAPGTYVVTNNKVGSYSTPNSIQIKNGLTSTTFYLRGIFASNGTVTVSGNMIRNMTLNGTGIGGKIWGIAGSRSSSVTSPTTISDNTISNLKTMSNCRSSGNAAGLMGIGINYALNSQSETISGNTIYNLHDSGSVLVYIYGIYNETSQTAPVNLIEKNVIYNLGSSSDTATVVGIYLSTGQSFLKNNMISLGYDAYGNEMTKAYDVTGIRKATSATTKVFFNTIKIIGTVSGAVTSTTIYSNAFRRSTAGVDSVYNNIFINLRTNSTSTQKHFAMNLDASTTMYSDYNILYCPNGYTGTNDNGTTSFTTLSDWQTGVSKDINSKSKAVTFAADTDLHISGGSIGDFDLRANPRGNITTDLDGETRYTLAPYMGCDERTDARLLCQLALNVLLQGEFNGTDMPIRDTIKVRLHSAESPYSAIDSATVTIDSVTGACSPYLYAAKNGIDYYIVVLHKNSIETWSAAVHQFTNAQLAYDFTSAQSQAYGDNMAQVGAKWCIYTGDVNQDGFVDFTDLGFIDNDSYNYVSGNVVTDLNGDAFVDFTDLGMCDNNSYNYIGVAKPSGTKRVKIIRVLTK